MRTCLVVCFVALLVGVIDGSVWADLPGPGPRPRPDQFIGTVPQIAAVPPPNAVSITVAVSEDVTQPTLTIPRPMLEKCAARVESRETKKGFNVPAVDHLLLALALVGGGLCLLRGRVRLAFAAVLLMGVGVALGLGGVNQAIANGPAFSKRMANLRREAFETNKLLNELPLDDVKIVVSPEWGDLKLTLPPSVAAKLKR